jgi:hypothetical protein
MTDPNRVEINVNGERVEVAVSTLRYAFEMVENKQNWKLPVAAKIAIGNRFLIAAAIEFFTGSVAKFEPAEPGMLWVRAVGYYEAVGA